MDSDLKDFARLNMREAMRREIKRNQDIIDQSWIKRNSPRELKEAVFYAMSRNNAINHFLLIDDPIPSCLHDNVVVTEEYRQQMRKAGATKYPLEIKRKAEMDLYYDYTHIDYKQHRHFIDKILPEKPKPFIIFELMGKIIGLIGGLWWILLIVIIGWNIYIDLSQPSNNPSSSLGNSNTFGSGGISGGNSTSKSISDDPQIKDGSGQSGFGNSGMSGHDSSNSVASNSNELINNDKKTTETKEKESAGKTTEIDPEVQITIPEPTPIHLHPSENKKGYFSFESTKEEVISVMGEPDTKSISSFSYGFSLVFFNQDKVIGWSTIDRILKVSIGNKKSGSAPFTVGSTKKQVVDAMGTPNSADNNSFTYGYSLVFFDTKGTVSGWSKIGDSQLKVEIGKKIDGAEPFMIGSTIEEVVAVMGTPDTYNETLLGYDYSLVFLQNGKVSSYTNISNNLKVIEIR